MTSSSSTPPADRPLVALASAPGHGTPGQVTVHAWDHGELRTEPLASASIPAPTWLQWSPDGSLLHVGNEIDEGAITTLAVEADGSGGPHLREVGGASTGGSGPCHFAFVGPGPSSHLVVANYRDGTVSALALDERGVPGEVLETVTCEGSGPVTDRQEGSHPHMIVPGPAFDGFSVVDLGTDEIRSHRLAPTGLVEHAVSALPPGTGPRQLVRVPGTDTAWLAGELSGTVLRLREEVPGHFGVTGEWPASGRGAGSLVAHLAVDGPRGLLYVSNRGPDTISVFDISTDDPTIVAEVETGAGPRHFELQRDRLLVGGQAGDVVSIHALTADGLPGPSVDLPVVAPACVASRPPTVRQR